MTIVTHEQRVEQQRLTMSPPDISRINAWKRVMTHEERCKFEKVAGSLLILQRNVAQMEAE